MSVFDTNGNALTDVYGADGTGLNYAYDVDGNIVYQKTPINLKIMTYNVGGWRIGSGTNVPADYDAQYYALQNVIIGNQDADILCLQEYWDAFSPNRTAQSLLSQYYPYIHTEQGNTTYWGHAICSKYPIVSYIRHTYTNDTARYYDTAVVNVDGRMISVINTHLGLTTDVRVVQAQELRSYIATLDEFILCGDFNTTYAMGTSGEESEEYTTVWLPFIQAGCHLANCSDENGFHGTYWNYERLIWRNLDNIVVSADSTIDAVWTDQTKVTNPVTADPDWRRDHIPLIAEVTIE